MKFAKPSAVYSYCFWISMPFITFALMYILYDERVWTDWTVWVVSWPIIYVLGYLSYRAHVQYDFVLHQKLPSLQQTGKRLFFMIAINLLVMTPSVLLIFLVFQSFHILGYQIKRWRPEMGLAGRLCNQSDLSDPLGSTVYN